MKQALLCVGILVIGILSYFLGYRAGINKADKISHAKVELQRSYQEMMSWNQMAVMDKVWISSLSEIESIDELQTLITETKGHGLDHISLFRQKAIDVKELSGDPRPIEILEQGMNELEQEFAK